MLALPPRAALAAGPKATSRNVEVLGQAGGMVWSAAAEGRYAYVGLGQGLLVLEVSDPAHPAWVSRSPIFPDDAEDVAVREGIAAYVADRTGGLQLLDLSDPRRPAILGADAGPEQASAVAVSGTVAYVADLYRGLRAIDVSDPRAPRELGFYSLAGQSWGVALAGSVAYIANGSQGLRLLDISDAANPSELGQLNTTFAYGVAIAGSMAYVADLSRLRVVDVSDPRHPAELGATVGGWAAQDVCLSGDTAYVADYTAGLRLVDVADPREPKQVGLLATPGHARRVAVAGSAAYLCDALAMHLVDISEPTNPTGWAPTARPEGP
jgi:hypothetical protein